VTTCGKCGKPHSTESCRLEVLKCANCGGGHQAGDLSCPKLVEVKQTLKVKSKMAVTYKEAATLARKRVNPPAKAPHSTNKPVVASTVEAPKKAESPTMPQEEGYRPVFKSPESFLNLIQEVAEIAATGERSQLPYDKFRASLRIVKAVENSVAVLLSAPILRPRGNGLFLKLGSAPVG